ncbi:hypothetical protein HAZT_HAZT009618 [Hyalella azteca]|uniref:C2H2-type domain-containing protein n=1 Tax=Hyalella azteca TaxID=294128 RepID=A0A6A0HDJ2_HYAAZ|nr:hypothetical protein HAZT_HAZT009618 [Hyalella azteca]
MYAGEVNVPQAHLPTLIKAAETLQIKGLAAPDEEPAQGLISGIRVKEEGESSDRDLDDSVAQVWQQQQGSTAVSWSNESASDLSWLPFTAARDRMGLLMEVKDHGEGSLSDGALRMSRAQVNPDGGAASEDLPPLLLSPSAVTSLTSEAPVDAASMDTSNKSNKINWASSDSHRRRTSFDGCNGSDLRNSSLIFDANRGEGKSLVGTGGAFNFFSGMAPSKLGHGRVAHRQLLCPYPQCGYVTDRDSWLKTHMRKHTGERPFSCPHCPYRSAQKSNLTVHVRKVHAKDREEFQHFNAVPGTSVPFDRWPSNDSMSDHSMPGPQHPSHSTIEQATTRPSSSSTSFSVVDLQSAHLDALGALMNLPSSSLQIPSFSEQLSSPPNNSTRSEATSQDTVSSIAEVPRLSKSQS